MIDEKKLIEKLQAFSTSREIIEYTSAYDVVQDCIAMVENQPQADKWISCEERLPSERDWYLAVFQEADTEFQLVPMVADYIGTITKGTTEEGWCIAHCTDTDYPSDEYYKKLKCVAWTNLPKPYKKEGAE